MPDPQKNPFEQGSSVEVSPAENGKKRKRGAPKGNKNARHHGAPPGNNNATKHGLYSQWFTREEHTRLDRDIQGQLNDHEISLNILIDRIFATMNDEQMTHDKYVVATRAVALAVGRIESIHRSRKVIYDNQTTIEKALDELKYIDLEDD
jgi:hypothetical protein